MNSETKPPHPCDGTSAPVLTRAVLSSIDESDQLDVSHFRMDEWVIGSWAEPNTVPTAVGVKRAGNKSFNPISHEFFAGPIDMVWLEAAASLPGAALNVALAIQHQVRLRKTDWVPISNGDVKRFGVKRDAKARAIAQLAEGGLIEVQAHAGRSPRVRVIGDRCRFR